jgi:hypothetical protein
MFEAPPVARASAPAVKLVSDLPASSAAATAHRRFACPDHGLLDPNSAGACLKCEKKAYDVDDADDRNVLTSLREVAKSARLTRARIFCYPLAWGLLVLPLGIGAFSFLLTPIVGEFFARFLERGLRKWQPAPLSVLDNELLK